MSLAVEGKDVNHLKDTKEDMNTFMSVETNRKWVKQ